jgi:hypothetical protein
MRSNAMHRERFTQIQPRVVTRQTVYGVLADVEKVGMVRHGKKAVLVH